MTLQYLKGAYKNDFLERPIAIGPGIMVLKQKRVDSDSTIRKTFSFCKDGETLEEVFQRGARCPTPGNI